MLSDPLQCLGPLDGRYAETAAPLRDCFCEAALMRRRAAVETEWLIRVNDIPQLRRRKLNAAQRRTLRAAAAGLDLRAARKIKTLEKKTRHDVKALEYWMADELTAMGLADLRPLLHFACTSWDINNIAFSLSVRDALRRVMTPALRDLQSELIARARDWAALPMLARTHGQPASPTTVGKEFAVFAARLAPRLQALERLRLPGKMNGATGNYNAHCAALPNFDWPAFCRDFVESFDLRFSPWTTQIEPYDDFAELCNRLRELNNILLDCCRDLWGYIALEYFHQRRTPGEVGSSTMPHKVNPIDFENAEGNLGIASALFAHFADKLPVSRWQRDLSDSTVLRATGTAFGHALVAWRSVGNGLARIAPNEERLRRDLAANWQVLAEAEQTMQRAVGPADADAYERMKKLTRRPGAAGDAAMRNFLRKDGGEAMQNMRPEEYIGVAAQLAAAAADELGRRPRPGQVDNDNDKE